MTQYAGSPVYPTDFTIADDSVAPTAAVFNVGLEALGDRTAFLNQTCNNISALIPVYHSNVYTSGTTLVVPSGVTRMTFAGVGGGGGGGGGAASVAINTNVGNYGGGGGGARQGRVTRTVVPGETLTIVIGAAGAAGAAGAVSSSGGDGGNGGDTTITGSTSGLLATFRGAQAGQGGSFTQTNYSYGGMPTRPVTGDATQLFGVTTTAPTALSMPGQGGCSGQTLSLSRLIRNGGSSQYADGGAIPAGAPNYAGGGGGASEWPSGAGGNAPVIATAGAVGNVGNAGAFGSGGSGGGGGNSTGASVAGAAGGAGGAGVAEITWSSP